MQWTWLCMVVVLGCAPLCWSAEPPSPYAGQEQREIQALSTEEIEGYLSGSGMGLAKAAELNHSPGPRHVLDLAESLQLSAEQRQKTQTIFAAMRTEAVRLDTHLIARERQLDILFAAGTISEAQVEQLVTEIATIHGQLRAVHLRAHLAQRAILTPDQLHRYDTLRGYNTFSHDYSGPHRGHSQGGPSCAWALSAATQGPCAGQSIVTPQGEVGDARRHCPQSIARHGCSSRV